MRAQGQTAACWPWWLLPLPAVAARLFVSFRGAARNGFRARQSGASIPAYRDMQLEAHRIQDTQNGFEIWMLRIAFKGTIDRRSFKPGYFGDVGDVVQTNGGADGMTYFVDVGGLKSAINAVGDFAAARLPADGRSGRGICAGLFYWRLCNWTRSARLT
jgi:hypothetical protein